jgi:hypothetical protein
VGASESLGWGEESFRCIPVNLSPGSAALFCCNFAQFRAPSEWSKAMQQVTITDSMNRSSCGEQKSLASFPGLVTATLTAA